jgi:AraC-like DNA-binding protein
MTHRGVPRIVYADAFRRLCRARDLIHARFDEALTTHELARAAGMSRFHFLRLFHEVFGVTPRQYLMRVRLERSCELLARGTSVTQTCFDVGFSSLGSFSTLFRREHGRSPSDYQRRVRTMISVPETIGRLWVPHCFLVNYTSASFEKRAPVALG